MTRFSIHFYSFLYCIFILYNIPVLFHIVYFVYLLVADTGTLEKTD